MKTIKWNIGIFIICIGYRIRRMYWVIGKSIVKFGYKFRNDIPMKTWKYNHV